MFPYIPNTSHDKEEMLESIGVSSCDELFKDVPIELKLNRKLNLNDSISEIEVAKKVKGLSKENLSTDDLTCFLGAGAYDHYIPAVVDNLSSRSEFYTAYTPYQAEISQGTLQAIFEYQTMIANLTGMDVSNASLYDGAHAAAEASIMAIKSTRRKDIIISKTVSPEIREVVKTYLKNYGGSVIEVDYKDGETDVDAIKDSLNKDSAAVLVQNPNFFGVIEDLKEIEKITHENKSLFIMSVDPISLGILKNPGEVGADIAVGEGQSLGNPVSFGGPYLGFMATTKKFFRKMPGRIIGETQDVDGKRGFVLTLQAREQHIRREKATSNICSNEGLNALKAAIYLATMGKKGIREVAVQCALKAKYAYDTLIKTGKFKPVFNKPFFEEFVLKSDTNIDEINKYLLSCGILGGYNIGKNYPHEKNSVLICVTEKRTKKEIDTLAEAVEGYYEKVR